jgi:hypothetical protein
MGSESISGIVSHSMRLKLALTPLSFWMVVVFAAGSWMTVAYAQQRYFDDAPSFYPYPDVAPPKWPEPHPDATHKPGMTPTQYWQHLCKLEGEISSTGES